MVKCASNNCVIWKNKVATAFFAVCMMNAKSPCMPSVPRHFCQKWNRILPWKMEQIFNFVVQDMVLPILRQDNPSINQKINQFVWHRLAILDFKF